MRVAVTGGAGAIGANLCRDLVAAGAEVVILDDLSSGSADHVPPGAELVVGSVEDRDLVERILRPRPDRLVHLAALFANQNSVEHPERDLAVNGLGTLNVLAAATAAGVPKVLYTSSSCVYGPREVMSEADPIDQLDTPYAVTKLLGEHYAQFWARHHGLDVLVVRLFNVYGPFELPGRYRNVVPNFLAAAIRGEPLLITGSGEETRDFTYVEDAVRGLVAGLEAPTVPGDVINIGSGRETRISELARLVVELSGREVAVERIPRREWDHVDRRLGVIDKARRVLGYEPRVELPEGLARTLEWLRSVL